MVLPTSGILLRALGRPVQAPQDNKVHFVGAVFCGCTLETHSSCQHSFCCCRSAEGALKPAKVEAVVYVCMTPIGIAVHPDSIYPCDTQLMHVCIHLAAVFRQPLALMPLRPTVCTHASVQFASTRCPPSPLAFMVCSSTAHTPTTRLLCAARTGCSVHDPLHCFRTFCVGKHGKYRKEPP